VIKVPTPTPVLLATILPPTPLVMPTIPSATATLTGGAPAVSAPISTNTQPAAATATTTVTTTKTETPAAQTSNTPVVTAPVTTVQTPVLTGSSSTNSAAKAAGSISLSGGFVDAKTLTVTMVETSAFSFPIPLDTFTHSDPKAAVQLTAQMADGTALPAWMSLDPVNKLVTGTPPQGATGEYKVVVTATDQFGGNAKTELNVNIGK
jgi:hypothetical protein